MISSVKPALRGKTVQRLIKRLEVLGIGGGLYFMTFFFVENRNTPVTILHTAFDDMIPFCEYFIIPYFAWFAFVMGTVAFFAVFGKDDREYLRLISSLVLGMAVFLAVCFIFPNGQDLRPDLGEGENIFQKMCIMLYSSDTSTNILPSLHCYNAVVCCITLLREKKINSHKLLSAFFVVFTISIMLATLFLKQHTIIDVIAAVLLNYIAYMLFYKFGILEKFYTVIVKWENIGSTHKRLRKKLR